MKAFSCNIIALLALVTANAVAAQVATSDSVSIAAKTTASSTSDFSTLAESYDEEYNDDEPFDLSSLLPELFPELVARAKTKPGCMGGTWKACHDWTVRQCPLRCTGLPRRRHPCTQRCILGADIQCQKACS